MKLPNMISYGSVIVESEVGVYVLTVKLCLLTVSKQILETIFNWEYKQNFN